MARRNPAPDQEHRDAAIRERARNVLVDAGAGTGKTTILVERLVEMVAPQDAREAVPIGRIAAITFTRKAAGELRLRIRERLLRQLADERPDSERARHLREALAGLDTAYIGTIHSFADRLLRLRPVDASLSPSYEIAEDEDLLIRETYEVLTQAVESGTLGSELEGHPAADWADEATQTIVDALGAGLRAESQELEWITRHGLDGLVKGFILHRDLPPPDESPAPFDAAAFRKAADEMIRLCAGLPDLDAPGIRWLRDTADALRAVRDESDPVLILGELRWILRSKPEDRTKAGGFATHDHAYRVWKAWTGDTSKSRLRDGSLCDKLRAPLHRWMATRLVRLFPVVIELYERVKGRHRQLDQLDLLMKLRDLLADNFDVRGEFQRMFDHVFVDEFQDTDPLQAEIVLYLCEREPRAARWDDIELAPGRLTLVGDPKQSIYRFRRADVAMYDRVRRLLRRHGCLEATLSANFRSVPPLIDWFNDRFAKILDVSPDGAPFDATTGRVFQQDLAVGRQADSAPPVHVLQFDLPPDADRRVENYRRLEGRVLARYLRWLVESSGLRIADPLEGRLREVGYGDIAVLAISTWQLSVLFPHFDEQGVPYASRGGTLFLQDPLHRQFLLGLRAVADRDDGVAEAALLRPPFFAVDLLDLARARMAAPDEAEADEGVLRARDARAFVLELRRRRFERPPGATARDLLERTAFARTVALGPNGTQRLARLREVCLVLEQLAAREGLDYDQVTARAREWIARPIQLDPPHPVGTEAVQVLTVHQAKGLEFPVVAIWDGRGQWDTRPEAGAWRIDRDGAGWIVNLDGLGWEEPAGRGLGETERQYLAAERRRVVYVAATRARDVLIVPKAGETRPDKFVCGALLADVPEHVRERTIHVVEPYIEGREPAWARLDPPRAAREPADGARVQAEVDAWWAQVSAEAARPRYRPASVSGEAHGAPAEELDEMGGPALRKPRMGRFGHLFGTTVHHAIALALREPHLTAEEAAHRAARLTGLAEHLDEAVADVTRALDALRREGLVRPVGADLQLEYPVAAAWEGGQLLSGYVDLVAVADGRIDVLDFKTDTPPAASVEQVYPQYAAQVRTYGRLLAEGGIVAGRALRCGLLFTGDGGIRWVQGGEGAV